MSIVRSNPAQAPANRSKSRETGAAEGKHPGRGEKMHIPAAHWTAPRALASRTMRKLPRGEELAPGPGTKGPPMSLVLARTRAAAASPSPPTRAWEPRRRAIILRREREEPHSGKVAQFFTRDCAARSYKLGKYSFTSVSRFAASHPAHMYYVSEAVVWATCGCARERARRVAASFAGGKKCLRTVCTLYPRAHFHILAYPSNGDTILPSAVGFFSASFFPFRAR